MYAHILVPTDGSELSREAVTAAVAFAKDAHAQVTGYFVANLADYLPHARFRHLLTSETELKDEVSERVRQIGMDRLRFVEDTARAAGVACDIDYEPTTEPIHDAIVGAAKRHRCDLIFMATHARKGLAALTFTSETKAVMVDSTIPVLVYRSETTAQH
jgi:nucleotide-binding universal stress UspA family protein